MVAPESQSPLPQFIILVYEREVPDSAAAASPTVLEAHMWLPHKIAETGGRIIAGHAARNASAGVSIRDNVVSSGTLLEGEQTFAGYFIVEASDLDHAVWIGRMIPTSDGWVEVRPLVTA
ncbi:YciI family protein [Paractinoplanes atraurantiacus]|uniref:Uncharacterized conserved protein n=1 Tax=Paractinoplanes atraurantiacus TaxID=1036182 RepID=A0A285JRX6_9ACTN|nr:hypothetical protein [Actinoplanes atraurantiacus]SNY63008.1 Uncharacterized conserved protein [Actinoplanes atraurantiacus]